MRHQEKAAKGAGRVTESRSMDRSDKHALSIMLTDLANKTLPGKHPPQPTGKTAGLSLVETQHTVQGNRVKEQGKEGP